MDKFKFKIFKIFALLGFLFSLDACNAKSSNFFSLRHSLPSLSPSFFSVNRFFMLQPLLGVRKRPAHLFICFAIYTFADFVVFNNRATIGLLVQDSGNRVIIIFTHPWYHHIIIELCHKNDYLHYQCLIFMIDIIVVIILALFIATTITFTTLIYSIIHPCYLYISSSRSQWRVPFLVIFEKVTLAALTWRTTQSCHISKSQNGANVTISDITIIITPPSPLQIKTERYYST